MATPNDGGTNLPSDASSRYAIGIWDGAAFWALRADNATAKNLKVAAYDAAGNPLFAGSNPGSVSITNWSAAKGAKNVYPAVTVAQVAVQLLAPNASRKAAYFANNGSVAVWLGPNNSITVGQGALMNPGDRLIDGDSVDGWWAISATGSNPVAVMEVA